MSNKILLCISNTGGGHLSAANALRSAINELLEHSKFAGSPFEIVIADVVEDSNGLNRLLVALYDYLLRYRQEWMKYYYRLIQFFKPDSSAVGYWLVSGYAKHLLRTLNPVIVVSIHPMANYYLARALKEIKLPNLPKLIEVVLDPNAELWTGWACPDADLIVAPNNIARERLIALGIEPARIVMIGMPVDPQFLHPPLQSRETFLEG